MAALTWIKTPLGRDQWVERWAARSSWINVILGIGFIGAVALLIVQHYSSHTEVYLFEVNSHGDPVGRVVTARGDNLVADKVFRREIYDFLRDAFTITDHVSEQKRFMAEVEAQCDQDTWDKLKAFWALPDNDPRAHMQQSWQEVNMISLPIRMPERDTYAVRWETIRHDYFTGQLSRKRYAGTMRVQADDSIDPSPLNDFAIRVSGFDFAPETTND